ncbi:MAG: GNAT family N-acetyltransferase [Chloroflexi bacterium]|nr:GNAT family N-acetyltransferase [Chloroflexota bacterium]MCI0576687.1 GNAT family N-acetyltransferase [Chloroflexota bacterium]MCI0646851.1 GNAT family N-acetyltransferase [Chloroflexota bacterium]MCI0731825.1 GNAT family N-acetyltransferase [Chloroflexota bacterium]
MDEIGVVRVLDRLEWDDLRRLVTGYTTSARYVVNKTETAAHTTITLQLLPLPEPHTRRYSHIEEETYQRYTAALSHRLSLGAYDGDLLVGLALAEPQAWNRSLWVWEFHVTETHRRQGLGRRMMDSLAELARAAGLRVIVCETQNTNVPAIHFYRQLGFELDGIDLSYYTNEDYPDGEIAVFMKRRL